MCEIAAFMTCSADGRKIIVTCHGSECINDTQNHVEQNQWLAYAFLHHQGNYHPRVIHNVPPQPYLVLARSAVVRGNHRAALQYSRQALQSKRLLITPCDMGLLAGDTPWIKIVR